LLLVHDDVCVCMFTWYIFHNLQSEKCCDILQTAKGTLYCRCGPNGPLHLCVNLVCLL
jgi:hypothetical protein